MADEVAELCPLASSRDVSGAVATRARIVLWTAEGQRRKNIFELASVSLPTVGLRLDRYARCGVAGLEEYKRGAASGAGSGPDQSSDPSVHSDHAAGRDRTVALVVPRVGRYVSCTCGMTAGSIE